MKHIVLILVISVLTINCAQHKNCEPCQKTLQNGSAEQVGMSAERLARIDTIVNQYINNEWIPGATAIIARKGKIVYHKSFGMRDIESQDPAEVDDIYRIASMTKALTSVSVMMLFEEGHFLLDDPISRYIPEFKAPQVLVDLNTNDTTYTTRQARREITIRDLLRHTSGIGYGFAHRQIRPIYDKHKIPDGIFKSELDLKTAITTLAKLPLLHDPGERFTYGLNTDVLGYFIEVISGKTLEQFFKERLLEPLQMNNTYFYLPDDQTDRLAKIYFKFPNTQMQLNSNQRYNYPFEGKKQYFSGGAGLCSTVEDYAKFMQMLINGGNLNGTQFLSRKTIDLITTDQVKDIEGSGPFGLGFALTTTESAHKTLCSLGNFYWSGYFSTSYWLDPEEELVAAFFTQMQPNQYDEIHQKFQVLVYQAIIE